MKSYYKISISAIGASGEIRTLDTRIMGLDISLELIEALMLSNKVRCLTTWPQTHKYQRHCSYGLLPCHLATLFNRRCSDSNRGMGVWLINFQNCCQSLLYKYHLIERKLFISDREKGEVAFRQVLNLQPFDRFKFPSFNSDKTYSHYHKNGFLI